MRDARQAVTNRAPYFCRRSNNQIHKDMSKIAIIVNLLQVVSLGCFIVLFRDYWKDHRFSKEFEEKRNKFVNSLADTVNRLNPQIRTLTEDLSRLRREVKELRDKVEQPVTSTATGSRSFYLSDKEFDEFIRGVKKGGNPPLSGTPLSPEQGNVLRGLLGTNGVDDDFIRFVIETRVSA